MGRIKTSLVKRNTLKLIEIEPDLTIDFNENKEIIGKYIKVSKKIRNAIAGYIARIKKQQTK
jgi:ribosomal protein S17E